jgi:hypothetical protein
MGFHILDFNVNLEQTITPKSTHTSKFSDIVHDAQL